MSEAGRSGNEKLKKWPPPSPMVLWFVNSCGKKKKKKKKKKQIEKKVLNLLFSQAPFKKEWSMQSKGNYE